MGLLGRSPDRDAVVGAAILGQDAAAFDRMPGAAMLPEVLVEDMRRLVEGGLGVAEGYFVRGDDVGVELAADCGSARFGGLAAVRGGWQHVVIDLDQGSRVLGDVAVIGDDDGDRLADIGDFAVGERERPHPVERRPGIRVAHHAALGHDGGEVVESQHRVDTGEVKRGSLRDAANCCMGIRAANEARVQDARHHDVVDEAALPAQQGCVFETRDA